MKLAPLRKSPRWAQDVSWPRLLSQLRHNSHLWPDACDRQQPALPWPRNQRACQVILLEHAFSSIGELISYLAR